MKMFILITFICSSFLAYSAGRNPTPERVAAAQRMIDTPASDTPADVLIRAQKGLNLLGATNGMNVTSLDVDFCSLVDINRCNTTAVPVPKDYADFLTSFSIYNLQLATRESKRDTENSCACLKDKLKSNKSEEEFEAERRAARTQVQNKILDAYGRKFISDFSANLEDVSFFLRQSASMFNDPEKAKEYQCNDVSRFNNAISQKCPNADPTFLRSRKNKFINILSGRDHEFDSRLGVMANEIMGLKITSDFEGRDKGATFVRDYYDQMRYGLSLEDPTGNFVNVLFSQMMRSESMREKINAEILTGKNPIESLVHVIETNKNTPAFRNLGLGANASIYLKDRNTLVDSLMFMMKAHPGFMYVMKDNRAFQEVKLAYMRSPEIELHTALSQKGVLEPVVAENCEKMIEEFAHAVCTPDDELISRMDPIDLDRLLKANKPENSNPTRTPQIEDLLVCEAKNSEASGSKFSELANLFDKRLRSTTSDYYVRESAEQSGEQVQDAFSLAARLADTAKGRDAISDLISVGEKSSSSVSEAGVVSAQAVAQTVVSGRDMRFRGRRRMSRSEARQQIAENQRWERDRAIRNSSVASSSVASQVTPERELASSTTSATSQSSVSQSQATLPQVNPASTLQYVAPQTIVPASSNSIREAREQLRDYVAEKNGPVEAERVVSGLDDSAVLEMNRLRAQNQALLEESLKAETKKYEELKARLAQLENGETSEAQRPVTQEKTQDSDDRSAPTNLSSLRQSFAPQAQVQRAPASVQAPTVGPARVSGPASASRAAAASSSSDESSSRARRAESASGLTLTATSVQPADVQTTAVNQEVRKLLENPSTNVASLEEIKQKGFVYRYTTVENDQVVQKEIVVKYETLDQATKDALEKRITQKAVDNQVSKLAVLRLLIRGNTGR